MKLTAILLIAFSFTLNARSVAQNVTLNLKNATLEKVCFEIEKQTGFNFVYNTRVMGTAKPVTISASGLHVEEVLKQVFKDQPLNYRLKDKTIVITPKNTVVTGIEPPLPQALEVKGVVRDESGKPAAGVAVSVKGTTRGTTTNERGEFALNGVPDNAVLVFSSVNLQTFEVKVTAENSADLVIKLKAKISELADVTISTVNTGYQTISKERVNGSYYVVDSAAFNHRVSTDVLSRLEGIVPGLLVNRNVNSSSLNVSIRGHSTILANDQPLIVVDNFPYDGSIDNINPNDVESVTVLKDASAASIWGARSGNGVIVITTKKGRRYQPLSMELNSNVSIGKKPDLYYNPNFIASTDYIDIEQNLFNMGFYNSDLSSSSKPIVSPVVQILSRLRSGQITASDAKLQIDALRNNDVRNDQSNYLLQKSIRQQYSFNLKGGGQASDYFLSFGYDNTKSNSVANSNGRFTISGISNFYPVKNLTFTAGVYYVQSNSLTNDVTSDIAPPGKTGIYPYAQLVDASGNHLSIERNYSSLYTDTVGKGKLLNWKYTPLDEVGLNDDKSNTVDNRINLGVRYGAAKGFSVDAKFQYQKAISDRDDYSNDSSYNARNLYNRFSNLTTGAHPVPAGGILSVRNGSTTSYRSRLQLNYNRSWDLHSVTAIAGAEVNSIESESSSTTYYGYDKSIGSFQNVDLITVFPTLPSGTSKIPATGSLSATTDRFLSYFANASYLYRNKYSITGSARTDKSNLFGVNTNQKSVPLYSVGAGWDFKKEKFIDLSWLNTGKLRITYGYNGNLDKTTTAITTFNTSSNSIINGITLASISSPGNPDLRWEKISMLNLGLDFGLLKNRVSGSFEYYWKEGYDLFGDAQLAGSTGLTTQRGNFANSSGHGFDFFVRSVNVTGKHINWISDLSISKVEDIVTKYDVSATVSSYLLSGSNNGGGAKFPLEGKPLFAIYSYPFAGLDATGDPMGYLNGKPSKDWASIISNTTTDSLFFHGSSRPTLFGSFRNSISYKGFSLSFNIIYKFGYYFRRTSFSSGALFSSWRGHSDYYQRWQKPGDELITNIPAMQYPPVNSSRETFFSSSSALVEKGDHIRLQDINFSYQFNSHVTSKLALKGLQVYTYLNNIGLLWRANNQHLDPDLYASSLPIPFTISFGLKANF